MKLLLAVLLLLLGVAISPVLSATAAAATFAPDTTGLYERRGEIKYTVEYYQQWTPKGNREKALAEAVQNPLFSSKDTYTFRGMNGHDYTCYLPEVAIEDELKVDLGTFRAAPLLAPLANVCIYRLEGWWTYELCYGKQIRQYHKNAEGKIEAEFSLGFSSAEEGREENDFFSTSYQGGTPCDVAQLSRSAQVRVRCGEGEATLISDIKEPSTCAYIIDVHTPLLCKHPKYARKEKKAHPIRCLQIVEVDPVHSTSSYNTNIRPIPSPLRDTDFVFRQEPPANPVVAEMEDKEEQQGLNTNPTQATQHQQQQHQQPQPSQQQLKQHQQDLLEDDLRAENLEDMLELQAKYQGKLNEVNKLLEQFKVSGREADPSVEAEAAQMRQKIQQLMQQLKSLGEVQVQLLDGTNLSEEQLRQLLEQHGIPLQSLEDALNDQDGLFVDADDLDEVDDDSEDVSSGESGTDDSHQQQKQTKLKDEL